MALVGSADAQSSVHVHIVTSHVQANQTLEHDSPAGPGGAQENEQARGSAAVRDHIQDGAEGGRLVVVPSSIAIQCIQQTRHTIEDRAGARVKGHVVERGDGKDHTEVP